MSTESQMFVQQLFKTEAKKCSKSGSLAYISLCIVLSIWWRLMARLIITVNPWYTDQISATTPLLMPWLPWWCGIKRRVIQSRPAIVCPVKYTLNYMMTSSNGSIFRATGPLCGEFTGPRWIPRTKASDAALWCFLWSTHEQTVEQTIVRLVIWDAIAPIMTSL